MTDISMRMADIFVKKVFSFSSCFTSSLKMLFFASVAVSILMKSVVASDDEWQADREFAINQMTNGNCEEAWTLLWKWGQTGSKEALNVIAGGIYAHGMTVPGAPTDKLALYRYIFIFLTHGLSERAGSEQKLFNALFGEILFPEKSGHPFGECLKGEGPIEACVDVAVTTELVPSFVEFVSEVNALSSANNQNSICLFNEDK